MAINRQLCLFFAHVPRTGGTSIENAFDMFSDTPYSREKLQGLSPEGFYWTHMSCDQMIEHGFVTQDELAGLFTFTFVRHPLRRFLSSWRHFSTGAKIMRGISLDDFADVAATALRSGKPLGLCHDAENDPDKVVLNYCHFRPQVSYLPHVRFVGHYERLTDDFAMLTRYTQHNCDLPVWYESDSKSFTAPHVIRLLVEELYADDYRVLGYSRGDL